MPLFGAASQVGVPTMRRLRWIDDKGRVFIYYSVKSVCEDLNCGTQKACKLLDELEKAGALERKRQGLGKPNKLYLKKVF